MQLEAIKIFCDIASFRSFSKAAAANELSQPAVSRVVHQLESRLGGQLIDRSRRPLELTPMGQTYYEGCKRLLEQYLELEASILHARAQLALTVHVAAIYSVGLGDMGEYIERFESRHPHIKIHIDYLHPDQVYERTLDGSADFGLVSFPRKMRELTILPWREEEMVVACPPHHPLAGQTSLPPTALEGQKYVAFDKGLGIRREVDRFLREHGVTVDVALEFDNIENIKKGIEVGRGLAFLPEPMLRQEVRVGTLRAIPLQGHRLVRPLGIIYRRRQQLGSAAGDFITLLQSNGLTSPPDAVGGSSGSGPAQGHSPHDGHTNGATRPRRKRTVS
jgi:DNA-binding transcriptional LysR family regulator